LADLILFNQINQSEFKAFLIHKKALGTLQGLLTYNDFLRKLLELFIRQETVIPIDDGWYPGS
jgi:hypothetical protein